MGDFEDVDIKRKKGGTALLELEDGTIIKMQIIIGKVIKLVDQYTPLGEPVYRVFHNVNVTAKVPKKLRKEVTLNLKDLQKEPNEKLYG